MTAKADFLDGVIGAREYLARVRRNRRAQRRAIAYWSGLEGYHPLHQRAGAPAPWWVNLVLAATDEGDGGP